MSKLTEHPLPDHVQHERLSSSGGGAVEERPDYLSLRRFTLKKYGLTPEGYLALWLAQDGRCAICRRAETAMRAGTPKMLAVDHSRTTGLVRGLLCFNCNVALGLFAENRESLLAAVSYLDRAPIVNIESSTDGAFDRVQSVGLPDAFGL